MEHASGYIICLALISSILVLQCQNMFCSGAIIKSNEDSNSISNETSQESIEDMRHSNESQEVLHKGRLISVSDSISDENDTISAETKSVEKNSTENADSHESKESDELKCSVSVEHQPNVTNSCENWTADNAPFADQCDCHWTELYRCLCQDKLDWSSCSGYCIENTSRNVSHMD